MPNYIGGPGLPLPPSGPLYPAELANAAPSVASNCYEYDLPPAGTLTIPAGKWAISTVGTHSTIEWFDGNVTNTWIPFHAAGVFSKIIDSDGVNWRVANLSNAAYAGIITAAGTGYAQATTTVTAGTGNSVWAPVIGGALSAVVTTAGGVYTKNPLIFIPAPPNGGVPASLHVTALTGGGGISTVAFGNAGAGYTVAPIPIVIPDPFDPNLAAGLITTPAVITLSLTGAGTLTGLNLVNFGQPLTSAPTLTVNGAGSSATATTNPNTGGWVAAATDTILMQRM